MTLLGHVLWLIRLALALAAAAGAWVAAGRAAFPETRRLGAALVVMAAWALLERVAAAMRSRARSKGDARKEAGEPVPVTAAQEVALIRRRLVEGFAVFRREGARRLRSPYARPWYLLIGPEGTGKSTVIGNSGLHLLRPAAAEETTRGCAVIATREAAFIDLAGTYVAQARMTSAVAAGWRAVLGGIAERRPLLPLNGVILTLSPSDLVLADPIEREELAQGIRARLEEATARVRLRLPVYLLLTKLDLVPGFIEYFDRLDADQRDQAWGFSFEPDEKNGSPAEAFVRGFDRLLDDLKRRQLDLLHRETDRRRAAMILGFPSQLAALTPVVDDMLGRIFAGGAHQRRRPLLRAVYLTSGKQDLVTIDRLLPSMAERFALPPAAALPPDLTIEESAQGWFIARPLRDGILREAGLVLRQRNPYRRLLVVRAALAGAVTATCVAAGVVVALQFQDAARNTQELIGAIDRTAHTAGPDAGMAGRVRVLDFVASALPGLPVPPPLLARLPARLNPDPAHMEALHATFVKAEQAVYRGSILPPLVGAVQDRLADPKASTAQLDAALAAYRMLGNAEPPEPSILEPWLQAAADKTIPDPAFAAERWLFVERGLAMIAEGPRDLPLDRDLMASAAARAARPTSPTQQ